MPKESDSSDSGKSWLQFWGVVITALCTVAVAYIGLRGNGSSHAPDPSPTETPAVTPGQLPTKASTDQPDELKLFDQGSPYPLLLDQQVHIGLPLDQLPRSFKLADSKLAEYDFIPADQTVFNRISAYLDVNQNVYQIYGHFLVEKLDYVKSQATLAMGQPISSKGSTDHGSWTTNHLAVTIDVDNFGNGRYLITAQKP